MRSSFLAVLSASAVILGAATMPSQAQGNGRGLVYVPESSIEHYTDIGFKAHTNHLLLYGSPANGSGVGGAMAPSDIRRFYNMPSTGGSNAIALVDAYDDRSALSDFNTFSTQYGLPTEPSTNRTASTNKVFQVVYAQGSKPRGNTGWSQEESLDIEWAHAMAPSAKIYLVEAASNSFANLYGAEDVAAGLAGVKEVSNSWSGGEYSGETSDDSHFQHSGVVYFASTGDTGGVSGYPAFSPFVVAAGGTSCATDSNHNLTSETGWSGSGGGNSVYEAKPSFQVGVANTGSNRSVPDVSSDADPNTGVSVFWNGGWYIFGGTSVSSPTLAGIANLAGHFRSNSNAENTAIYSGLGTANFRDITSGTAGSFSCLPGWDFVTGVGSPQGTADM